MNKRQATAALRVLYAELASLGAKTPKLDHWDGKDAWPADTARRFLDAVPRADLKPWQRIALERAATSAVKMCLHLQASERSTGDMLGRRLEWAWHRAEKVITYSLTWRDGGEIPQRIWARARQILEDAA